MLLVSGNVQNSVERWRETRVDPDAQRTLDETGDDLEKEADRLDDEDRSTSVS